MKNQTERLDLESTAVLIERARDGENAARERLAQRYLARLRLFARGRLPGGARSLEETDDLVQVAMMRAFTHLDRFRADRPGSFLVYLRVILDNLIRDRYRALSRRPRAVPLPDEVADAGARGVLDRLLDREQRERYERALMNLRPRERDAIILRFELDCSFKEVAEELRFPSANAARMGVERAMLHLIKSFEEPHR